MNKILISICFLFFFFSCVTFNPTFNSHSIQKSVFGLASYDMFDRPTGGGSFFSIGNDRFITAAHICEGLDSSFISKLKAKRINKYGRSIEEKIEPVILKINSEKDICLLSIPGLKAEPLEISNNYPKAGDRVYMMGFPIGRAGLISEGYFAGIDSDEDYMLSFSCGFGCSGGPVLNTRGEVIGVYLGYARNFKHIGFSCTLSELRGFLLGVVD